MKNMRRIICIILLAFSVFGCSGKSMKENNMAENGFVSVPMDKGLEMMKSESDFVLVDVRRPDEYSEGHIPGARLLTNETFTFEDAKTVVGTDMAKRVFVYCRSGRRSKEASKKLVVMGYTNVVEFGGILDYHGKIEK